MAQPPSIRPASTFFVHLWHEDTAEEPCWRGRIDHLQSGESRAFLSVAGLLRFVNRFVTLPNEPNQSAADKNR